MSPLLLRLPKAPKVAREASRAAALTARLLAAREADEFVSVRRALAGTEEVDGFVVATGARWILLAGIDHGLHREGWTALRLKDITSVQGSGAAAARPGAEGMEPNGAGPSGAGLDSIRQVLALGQGQSVTLRCERTWPGRWWTGEPDGESAPGLVGLGSHRFDLAEVTRVFFERPVLPAAALVPAGPELGRRAPLAALPLQRQG